MRANSGSICLLNPTTGLLEIEAEVGLPAEARAVRLRLGQGITGWVVRTGGVARVGNVSGDRRYVAVRTGVASEMAVPLRVGGEVRGVLNVDSDRRDAFDEGDQGLMEALAELAAQAIRNSWLYESARQRRGCWSRWCG